MTKSPAGNLASADPFEAGATDASWNVDVIRLSVTLSDNYLLFNSYKLVYKLIVLSCYIFR